MDLNVIISQMVTNAITENVHPLINEIKEKVDQGKARQDDGYLNLNNAAKYLDVTRQTLTTYMKNGVVKCHRLNGNPRFKKSDLDASLKLIVVELRKH